MTRRLTTLFAVVGLLLMAISASLLSGTVAGAAKKSPSGGGSASKTEEIVRENLVGGKEKVVDRRTVSLHVSETKDLRGRQEISVSWSGAHPTGGIVADENSIDAQQEEYPMVLLECRGVDSTKVKASQQLTPSTCWTQDWSERYQDSLQTEFPPYRLDQFASVADRAQVVGAPSPLPAACQYLPAPTQHWVPFDAANGHVYYGGPAGCGGQAPESEDVGGSALPSNETFGVTGLDGRGSAEFDVWTSAENASLGCSTTVPCALVAVPIMGISCDPEGKLVPAADRPPAGEEAADAASCEATGAFSPGELVTPEGGDDLAVSGSLWWSASNWRNRITIPLTFAVPDSVCDVVNSEHEVEVYGSELMVQATGQWAPHFCLDKKLFKFVHVQAGEPESRNLLASGGAEAAFTSYPQTGGYGRAVANAPVALTGFAISYVIDGSNGQPYTKLRLTPLLLAKLLTESYPAELPVQEEDPALSKNPLNITDDPEFEKLNPGVPKGVQASEAASELIALSSDSDVIEALTTYINDNPQARAWLNGKPDPDGMVVNPAYKGIKLPVDEWPLLSTFEPKAYYASDTNDCLYNEPQPFLPLVAAPMATLEEISESMQFDIANSTTVCSQIDGTDEEKLVALGPQTVGHRFLIGITPLADDYRYDLRPAALETTNGNYVAPDDASLEATAKLLKPDKETGTWPIPYEEMATASAGAGAYPGTMVVYAAVPTHGLPAEDAKDYAAFLRFAATSGQQPGSDVGQLPAGYLPLTKSDGLAALSNYTLAAANDVAAQNDQLPSVTANNTPHTVQPHAAHHVKVGSVVTPTMPSPAASRTTSHPTTPVKTSGEKPGRTIVQVVPAGHTLAVAIGAGGLALVLVLLLAAIGLVGVPATYLLLRRPRSR